MLRRTASSSRVCVSLLRASDSCYDGCVSDPQIFVVSDSTGETAERVVRASLLQFPHHRVRVRLFTRVRDQAAIEDVLKKASEAGAMVVFTLVSPELREQFHAIAAREKIESVDVIGSAHPQGRHVHRGSAPEPARAQMPLSEEYFRRVEAIEFAVKSDDGKEPRNLRKADLVLVGVSRTSKTPLSTYLAGRGLKVANVPLVLGVEPPPELDDLPTEKVIGVTIGIDQLLEIRRARLISSWACRRTRRTASAITCAPSSSSPSRSSTRTPTGWCST
jgi:regulator of PEP synthase PpsR (kinase-PPPase family)